jgi:hypothetical protein
MKLWLKSNPSITAETLRDTPVNGYIPVLVGAPDEDPPEFYACILPSEWSYEEIVRAPESVPEQGFLVLSGSDPARVEYEFHANEVSAGRALDRKTNGYGYVPVTISRNAMIPP